MPRPKPDPSLVLARAHVALGLLLAAGRALGATPALARGLVPHLAGQALLACAVAGGVLALGAAVWSTVRRPDPRALALGLLLTLALARRASFDAFDLVYLLAVLLLAVPLAFASAAGRPAAGDAGRPAG